ncbi:MAG: carbohydrate binding family 9 domain-containing protein [Vicinamibacteria bacterium]
MVAELATALSMLTAPARIPLVEQAPAVDCALDDAAWRGARVLDGFHQVHPGDNLPATHATEVRLALTADALYVAVRAEEAPGRVRATLAKRDAIEGDDTVALYLDTFQDRRRAYVVMVNPLGIQQDGVFVEGREPDWSVDLDLRSAGCLDARGYTVEIAVPLASLRWQAGAWGLQVVRQSRHSGEEDSWMPLRRDRVGVDKTSTRELRARFLAQAGTVTGLEAARHRPSVEWIPVATASRRDEDGVAGGIGATARFTPSSASALDLAVSPDFAEVEADAPQVTANQRFPLFFAEKRPFFLEGAELFRTPIRAFHSRSLVDPDVAAKATATRGRTSLVALAAADAAPGRVPEDDPSLAALSGRRAYAGVVRVKRDVGLQSSVGFLGTAWGIADRRSVVGGADGRVALGGSSVLTFQALGTASSLAEGGAAESRRGFGYAADWARSGRRTSLQLSGEGYSPGYRAALGYTQRVDTNRWSALARYNGAPRSGGPLASWSLLDTTLVQFDWRGRMQYAYTYPRLLLTFPRQGYLNLSAYQDYQRVFEEEFGRPFAGPRGERSSFYGGFTVDGGVAPSQRLSVSALYDRSWGNLDFDLGAGPRYPRVSPAALADPGAPLDPGPGASESVAATLAWQPTEALRLSGTWERSRLTRDDTGRVAYDQSLASVRAQYAFTRFASLRARLDYDSLDRGVFAQAVLGWSPRPGTVVYAGYDETGDFTEPAAPARASRYGRHTRTVYCKVSWALRTRARG